MTEAVRTIHQEVERRNQLIGLSKTRSLSKAEVKELQAIWEKEARHSFATGEIGPLAFVLIQYFLSRLPYLLPHGGING